ASFVGSTTSAGTQSGGSAYAASGKPPSVTAGTPPSQDHPDTTTSAGAQPDYSKEAFVIEQLRSRFRFENDGSGREENTIRVRVQSEADLWVSCTLVTTPPMSNWRSVMSESSNPTAVLSKPTIRTCKISRPPSGLPFCIPTTA